MTTTVSEVTDPTNRHLEDTLALLTRTPSALDALLRGLSETWTSAREGANTWNAPEVVAHLIHCERADWLTRANMILQFGESRVFDPLDRSAHLQQAQGQPLDQLLDEFARLRSANLAAVRAWNPQPPQLALKGRHPAFGSVTVSELLAAWAVHDLTHLHQLSRIFANQYRELVGPWSAYLGVLHCNGHGS